MKRLFLFVFALAMVGAIVYMASREPSSSVPSPEVEEVATWGMKEASGPFTRVEVRGDIDVRITQGEKDGYQLKGDRRRLKKIDVTVDNGVLKIEDRSSDDSSDKEKVTAHIQATRIIALVLQGNGDVVIEELDEEMFSLVLSGSGTMSYDGKVNMLNVVLNGGAKFKGEGKSNMTSIVVNGAGNVDTKKLKSKMVNAVLNGAGKMAVTADDELNAAIAGVGSIVYYGRPKKVKRKIVGAGSITQGD